MMEIRPDLLSDDLPVVLKGDHSGREYLTMLEIHPSLVLYEGNGYGFLSGGRTNRFRFVAVENPFIDGGFILEYHEFHNGSWVRKEPDSNKAGFNMQMALAEIAFQEFQKKKVKEDVDSSVQPLVEALRNLIAATEEIPCIKDSKFVLPNAKAALATYEGRK